MTSTQLFENIRLKRSFLCVGLDPEIEKIPPHLLPFDDPVFEFNKAIVDSTADLAIAYKPNLAFYEVLGANGWSSLQKTVSYIRQNHPEIFLIADAKRGDIGNTARMYAKTFFQSLQFDAITISPYMGRDSVIPFIEHPGKWVILLALTSNEGFKDFQLIADKDTGKQLFEEVLSRSAQFGCIDNMMYVVGATRPEYFERVRKIIPDHFLLVPGVGEQGGSLAEVTRYGMNSQCGLIVNSSRGIIYAGKTENFRDLVREKALELQLQMEKLLLDYKLL